jgi:hypothetical protein
MTGEVGSLEVRRYWIKQFNDDRTNISNQAWPGNPVIGISEPIADSLTEWVDASPNNISEDSMFAKNWCEGRSWRLWDSKSQSEANSA